MVSEPAPGLRNRPHRRLFPITVSLSTVAAIVFGAGCSKVETVVP